MLYEVKINWYGEIRTFHTEADIEDKAAWNAIVRLARKLKLRVSAVSIALSGTNAITIAAKPTEGHNVGK